MDLVLLVVAPVCIAVGVGVSVFMAWLDGCVDAEHRRVGKTKRGGMRVEFRATELPMRWTRQFGVVSVGKSGEEVALPVRENSRAKALSAAAVLIHGKSDEGHEGILTE